MSDALRPGKLPSELLDELLAEFVSNGDASNDFEAVRIGPAIGEDACAIDVDRGTLVAATDPITLVGSQVGSFAVTINANDVAVMGVQPRWFMAAVLLPLGTTESEVRALFASIREALRETGATLVGGHTEVTPVVSQPVVVGQMMGLSTDRNIVPTSGARAGDAIVQVGPAPIEAAVVLLEPALGIASIPEQISARARSALIEPGISVVRPALLAAESGATAMHDPTEGGLSTGLYELARASGISLEIDDRSVLWFEPGVALCHALGADPWGALASGTLLAAFGPNQLDAALTTLAEAGFEAAQIGIAGPGAGVRDQRGDALVAFERDEVARVTND